MKIPLCCFVFNGQIKVHLVGHCVSKRLIRVKFSRRQETNLSETEAHPLFLEKTGITHTHYHENQRGDSI